MMSDPQYKRFVEKEMARIPILETEIANLREALKDVMQASPNIVLSPERLRECRRMAYNDVGETN